MISRISAVFALALLALAVTVVPREALAHAILLEGVPAAGQMVAPGRLAIVLRFNSRIDAGRSRLTLQHGESSEILKIAAGERADKVVAEVEVRPGAQVLHWQVLAVDGHITRGEIRFTVGAAR